MLIISLGSALDRIEAICQSAEFSIAFSHIQDAEPGKFYVLAEEDTTGATIETRFRFNEETQDGYLVDLTIIDPDHQLIYKGTVAMPGSLIDAATEAASRITAWLGVYQANEAPF